MPGTDALLRVHIDKETAINEHYNFSETEPL